MNSMILECAGVLRGLAEALETGGDLAPVLGHATALASDAESFACEPMVVSEIKRHGLEVGVQRARDASMTVVQLLLAMEAMELAAGEGLVDELADDDGLVELTAAVGMLRQQGIDVDACRLLQASWACSEQEASEALAELRAEANS